MLLKIEYIDNVITSDKLDLNFEKNKASIQLEGSKNKKNQYGGKNKPIIKGDYSPHYVIFDKKVNLGLDLQGGSYLLLEINSDGLVEEKIQSKIIPLKKLMKENKLEFANFKIFKNNLRQK